MDSSELIELFYNRTYEKFVNKQILDDKNYIVPRQQLINYVHELINIPFIKFIDYIRNKNKEIKIEVSDITQFSSFSSCEIEMCNALIWANNPGCQFVDIGRFFPNSVSARNDIAYRKYGENHIKAATQLGLTFEYYDYWYLSCIGYIYPQLGQNDRMQFLARSITRNRLYRQMLLDILDHDISPETYMNMLSENTIKRRSGNVCTFMDICLDECNNQGIKTHSLIRRSLKNENLAIDYEHISYEESIQLFKLYKKGDQKAFDKLVKSYFKLVVSIANSYKDKGVEYDDLLQEGTLGLIRAIKRFDYTRSVPFEEYAKNWILQAMLLTLKTLPLTVKIPLNQISLHGKVHKIKERYEQKNEYEPSIWEMEIDEDVDPRTLEHLSGLPDDLLHLTLKTNDWEDNPSEDSADDTLMKESKTHFINAIIGKLKKRDADILRRAFGIGVKEETLEEIGDRMYLTRERVRQIKESAIRKLRDILNLKKEDKEEEEDTPQLRIINKDTVEQKEKEKKIIPSVPKKIKPKMSWERATFLDRMKALSKESETESPKPSIKHEEQTPTPSVPSYEEKKIEKASTIKEKKNEPEVGNVIEYDSRKCTVIEKKEERLVVKYEDGTIDNVKNNRERYKILSDSQTENKEDSQYLPPYTVFETKTPRVFDENKYSNKLKTVFDNKVTSYKYFWFLSIISLAKEKNLLSLSYKSIVIRMAAMAWPMVFNYTIKLGKYDMMSKYLSEVLRNTSLDKTSSSQFVEKYLSNHYLPYGIKDILSPLLKNVPYRFLSPWIKYTSDEDVIGRSNRFDFSGPYSLTKNGIVLKEDWWDYIQKNYKEVCDFTKQSFVEYIKSYNDNIKLMPFMNNAFSFIDNKNKEESISTSKEETNNRNKKVYALRKNCALVGDWIKWKPTGVIGKVVGFKRFGSSGTRKIVLQKKDGTKTEVYDNPDEYEIIY